jgi:Flp pilus assembly protein TadG
VTTVSAAERGETTAQFAVLAPVLFMCVFAVFHLASYWMSALTASAAATRGARAASMGWRTDTAWREAVIAVEGTVQELDSQLDGPPLVEIGPGNVRVTVRVRVHGAVPLFPDNVSRTSLMRLEQFVGESDR